MKILSLFFVYFSFLHIKGFVNSGYGVNGMAHVSQNGCFQCGMLWFMDRHSTTFQKPWLSFTWGCCISSKLPVVTCFLINALKNQKSESHFLPHSMSSLISFIREGESNDRNSAAAAEGRSGCGGWLARSFTCCCLSPDTASGAISRLHESQKTRTPHLTFIGKGL